MDDPILNGVAEAAGLYHLTDVQQLMARAAGEESKVRAMQWRADKEQAELAALRKGQLAGLDEAERLRHEAIDRELAQEEGAARAALQPDAATTGLSGYGSDVDRARAVATVQRLASVERLLEASLTAAVLQRETDVSAIEQTVADALAGGDRRAGERIYQIGRQQLMRIGAAQSRRNNPGEMTAGPTLVRLDQAMAAFREQHPTPQETLRSVEAKRAAAHTAMRQKFGSLRAALQRR